VSLRVRRNNAKISRVAVRAGVAIAVALTLGGCSSGSSAHPAASAVSPGSTATTTTAAPAPGGLVGAIDRARLLSVCENTRTADTAIAAGDTATASAALSAAVTLLLKPPVDAEAQAAGQQSQRLVAQGHDDQAVTALRTFCRKNHA
jgi:hypothetical protein